MPTPKREQAPFCHDWKITFHKKGDSKKAAASRRPVMRLGVTREEIARELWRCENIKNNRQAGLTCRVWEFTVEDGWIEVPRETLMKGA